MGDRFQRTPPACQIKIDPSITSIEPRHADVPKHKHTHDGSQSRHVPPCGGSSAAARRQQQPSSTSATSSTSAGGPRGFLLMTVVVAGAIVLRLFGGGWVGRVLNMMVVGWMIIISLGASISIDQSRRPFKRQGIY